MTPQEAYSHLSRQFRSRPNPSVSDRLHRLKSLRTTLLNRQSDIQEALWKDFQKPSYEVDLTEIAATIFEVNHAIRHLKSWIKPRRKKTPLYLLGTTTDVVYHPKGPSLIITPWNYAILLTMGPVIHAVAAGCPFVVKPSENTPHASRLLKDIISEVFPTDEAIVLEGDRELSKELLSLPFSHIHFTGSVAVGKVVMEACSKHLSSVTLELGGKSPVYVDETADLKTAARGICFGKFSNAGQTCIAPDYVLVHKGVKKALEQELIAQIKHFYGDLPAERKGAAYARIINPAHYDRLQSMFDEAVLAGCNVAFGGELDADSRYVEPTILTDVPPLSKLLQEEIFGPILPLIEVGSQAEAVAEILSRPPPLSTYIFSTKLGIAESFSAAVRTGAVCLNTTLLQFVQPFGPFGGEGNSGIGRSHGQAGFKAFSNEQVVMKRNWGAALLHVVQPPYSPLSDKFTKLLLRLG